MYLFFKQHSTPSALLNVEQSPMLWQIHFHHKPNTPHLGPFLKQILHFHNLPITQLHSWVD